MRQDCDAVADAGVTARGKILDIPGFLIPIIVLLVIAVLAVIGGILVLFSDVTDSKDDDRNIRATTTTSRPKANGMKLPARPSEATKTREVNRTAGRRVSAETGQFSSPKETSLSDWPPNAAPYYRPSLIAAIAASVGVMIGCVAPWTSVVLFTFNGLDAGGVGITALTLGAVSCAALLTVLFWPHTPFNPRWAVPLAWAVAVIGVAGLIFAIPLIIRIMTIPKTNIFGFPVGASVGWGLWLLAVSSVVLTVTARIVATQIAHSIQPTSPSTVSWANRWQWAAIIASAVITVSGITYYWINWDNNPRGSAPSPTELRHFRICRLSRVFRRRLQPRQARLDRQRARWRRIMTGPVRSDANWRVAPVPNAHSRSHGGVIRVKPFGSDRFPFVVHAGLDAAGTRFGSAMR
jgi:hypothetical protein